MAASGVMVIVRIGVRKSEIARISGIGRWRQGAAEGAVALAEGFRIS